MTMKTLIHSDNINDGASKAPMNHGKQKKKIKIIITIIIIK